MEPTAPDLPSIAWTDRGAHPLLAYCRVFQAQRDDGVLTAFAGREPIGWHVSVSHPTRLPTWGEVLAARDLAPDETTMAMVMPPRSDYVNVHETCFHLYEIERDLP
jgi:hypothetical protein